MVEQQSFHWLSHISGFYLSIGNRGHSFWLLVQVQVAPESFRDGSGSAMVASSQQLSHPCSQPHLAILLVSGVDSGFNLVVQSIAFCIIFLSVVNVPFFPFPSPIQTLPCLKCFLCLQRSYSLDCSRTALWLKWLKLYTACIINLCTAVTVSWCAELIPYLSVAASVCYMVIFFSCRILITWDKEQERGERVRERSRLY